MRPLIKNRSGNIGQSARSIVTRRSPFTPTSQWPDPTGIGWTASAIFNPPLIRHDGRLIVLYRASLADGFVRVVSL